MHYTLLHTDGIIILGYFGVVLAIGLSSTQRQGHDSTAYFLAGRKLGWLTIGMSFIAADVVCGHAVGLSAFSGNIFGIAQEVGSVIGLLALGLWLGPKLVNARPLTITEFLTRNYNNRLRTVISGSYILIYLLIRISLVLLFGSILIQTFSSADVNIAIAALILVAGIYTIVGGFSAVVNTQVFQMAVMFGGFLILQLDPSWGRALQNFTLGGNLGEAAKGLVGRDTSWMGLTLGIPILMAWLWLTDQYLVQRVLSARGDRDVKMGALAAVAIKVLIIIPACWLAYLYNSEPQLLAPTVQSAQLFRGIALVTVFSGLMASLSGLYNGASALFTFDFYRRRNPSASEHKLVLVARLSTTAAVLVSILWMPLISAVDFERLNSLQSLLMYFAAAIMAIFLPSLLKMKVTFLGIGSALVTGAVLCCLKIFGETFETSLSPQSKFLQWFMQSSYMDFAALIFAASLIVLLGVSLIIPNSSSEVAPAQVERTM